MPSPASEAVVHLIVRRSTGRLALGKCGLAGGGGAGGFELRVCGSLSGTARALADAAAAAAAGGEDGGAAAAQPHSVGAGAGRPPRPPLRCTRQGTSHRLLMDGVELPPDEPLAAAGVRPGAVLELVPAGGGCLEGEGEEEEGEETHCHAWGASSDEDEDEDDDDRENRCWADLAGVRAAVAAASCSSASAAFALGSSSSSSLSSCEDGGVPPAVAATPESRPASLARPNAPPPWSSASKPRALIPGARVAAAAACASSSSPSLSSPAHGLHAPWRAARAGLLRGRHPELAPAGSGGSYFLRDAAGARVAVFKPADEEPDAALNPRRAAGNSGGPPPPSPSPPTPHALGGGGGEEGGQAHPCDRAGILPGEGAAREVAAFLLDRGVAGVPPTALVDLEERFGGGSGGAASPATRTPAAARPVVRVRRGSLQAYVPHWADAEECGVAAFPVQAVHRIACLDVRLANGDRNASNVLVVRGEGGGGEGDGGREAATVTLRLVPIDHAFTLPATLGDVALEWRHWPQARLPLDEGAAAEVAALDAEADLETLAAARLDLRRPCATNLRVCTAFLKACAARRLPPATMAAIMMRGGSSGDGGCGGGAGERRSGLERLVSEARAGAAGGEGDDGDAALLAAFGPLLEVYLDRMVAGRDQQY